LVGEEEFNGTWGELNEIQHAMSNPEEHWCMIKGKLKVRV